jgi:peptide/nickel transport system substrate-binding protein
MLKENRDRRIVAEMKSTRLRPFRIFAVTLAGLILAAPLRAEPTYGIAMYGAPALAADFSHLPYANPDAPKGGQVVFGEAGTFDSLNPFITKGNAPAAVSSLTVETLMGRSYDEPFSLYGLLAQSIDTDDARTYVAFTLRPEAKFSDGKPVTVEDVLWSFETLGTQGSPRYAAAWKKIAKAEQTGPLTVKFTFTGTDREMPLILGLRPILEKAQWAGKDFTASTLEAPIGSGPYVVDKFDAGSTITFKKNPDWWGKDLAFNKGLWNFDTIKYEYFGSGSVVFESFKAGEIMMYRESSAVKWQQNYDFPAVAAGDVVKEEIPHQRPSGIEGFVMNTRRPIFADWHVREALIDAFNFELVNTTLNAGVYPRIASYYGNSELGADIANPAPPAEAALLAPFKDSLLPGALEGYSLPVSDGTEANRAGIRKAADLLEQAGFAVQDGVLKGKDGTPFSFEILLVNGEEDYIAAASIFVEALKRLGIDAHVTTVDAAQYKERTTNYDFDMTHYSRSLSLSPGNEQTLYWGADGVTTPGTRNWMGMNAPAAEAMVKTMLSARDHADFVTAVHALDRVLTSGRYVIPMWYAKSSLMAHAKALHHPDYVAIYGDWLGFMPDVWWSQP